MTKYTMISIPFSLAKELDKCIGHFGWRNRSDVARFAIQKVLPDMIEIAEGEKTDGTS